MLEQLTMKFRQILLGIVAKRDSPLICHHNHFVACLV